MMKFKRVLITGASSGIGEATAFELAKAGYNLFLTARREERLKALRAKLTSQFGVSVEIACFDVREADRIMPTLLTQKEVGEIDVLVNNAGLAKGVDKMMDAKLSDWDEMIDVNIKSLLYMTRSLLPQMIQNGRGHIINLGSVAGRWTYPGGAVYCASKFAVRALSEGLRMDLLGTPIRVTNIEPGMVESEFSQVRLGDAERAKAVYRGVEPLKPEDIAECIRWSLDRPAHVNIQELVIFPVDQASIQQVHRRTVEKPVCIADESAWIERTDLFSTR